ncbi:MAG TPA: hypothetical protein DEO87_07205 [Lachnospiraceae bacterium]|nr:hypothetical protein [Lachnospiraceae bacterium]
MIQIVIGMAVIWLLTVIAAVFHKKGRKIWIIEAVCMAVLTAFGLVCLFTGTRLVNTGNGTYYSRKDAAKTGTEDKAVVDDKGYLEIVKLLASVGDLSGAGRLLDEYAEYVDYNDEYLSVAAEIYSLNGETDRAEILNKVVGGSFAGSNGIGLKKDSVGAAVDAYVAVNSLIDMEKDDVYYSEEEIKEYYENIKEWRDEDYAYSELPTMRKARLSAELMLHNYDEIADRAKDDDADGEGLIIASQLLRSGMVEDRSIGGSVYSEDDVNRLKVLAFLSDELEDKDSFSPEEYEYLKGFGEDIFKAVNSSEELSGLIRSRLKETALSDSAAASKIYLELADIAYAEGNKDEAVDYLEKCLRSAAQSSDAEYAEIVNEINDILFRSGDPEERKHLADYVDRMERNRLPENIPDIDTNILDGVIDDDTDDDSDEHEYTTEAITSSTVDIWDNTTEESTNGFIDPNDIDNNNIGPTVNIWNNTTEESTSSFIDPNDIENNNNIGPTVDIWDNTTEENTSSFIDPNGFDNDPNDYSHDDYDNDYNNYDNDYNDYDNDYNNYDNDDDYSDDNNDGDDEQGASLSEDMVDTLNQMAGSVSIISINKDKFPKLTAVVSADEGLVKDADEFRNHMNLTDTDCELESFTVEKITYDTVNVILVCDDSGSMEGRPRDDLCAAVKAFVNNADADIKIGIVPFSSGVKESLVAPLGSKKDDLLKTADALSADGGTDIFEAVEYANTMFPDSGSKTLNIMILMSDGQDDMPGPDQLEALHETCVTRNISIYAVGLGSGVDMNLLEQYASYGNGSYFYVDSSDSIISFYNYIYSISQNRYLVSYEAMDTSRVDRYFEIAFDNSPVIYDHIDYSLFRNDTAGVTGSTGNIIIDNVIINGLKEKMIYPSQAPQYLTLQGKGFEQDAKMSIKLSSYDNYECTVEYIDSESARVTVPGKLPTGVYDVYVTYNGKRAVFGSGLIVAGGDTNVIRFGEYVFTASNITQSDNKITMSGVVILNDWLGFKDPVTLNGDFKGTAHVDSGSGYSVGTQVSDYSVVMDFGRTYIRFTDTSLSGLSGYYAGISYVAKLPASGRVTLYNDQTVSGSSDEYPVEAIPTNNFYLLDFLKCQATTSGLKIYPDRAVLSINEFTSAFPFQGKVMSVMDMDKVFHYSLEADASMTFSKDRVDFAVEVNFDNNKSDVMTPCKLGNSHMYLSPGESKLSIDTKKGEVDLKLTVNVGLLADGVGFEVALKDWKLDKIMLFCDKEINTYIGNIPVTIDDFQLGLQDMSKIDFAEGWTSIFNTELVGSCDISMLKISAIYPGLKKYTGDVSLLKLDDLTLGLRLKEFRIRAEATAKFLEFVEIGHAKLQLGWGLEYDNPLFIVQDDPNGFIGEATAGIKIDEDNFMFDISARINIAITDQAIGFWFGGDFHVKIGWWIFVAEESARGDLYFGFYRQQNGQMTFAVLAHGQGSGGKNVNFQLVWGENDNALASHKY